MCTLLKSHIHNLVAHRAWCIHTGYRTTSALSVLLTHKQLSFVLRACENLEVATALSTRCAERLVDHSAVPIIFQLIRSCNRSKPHTAVLVKALNIIANLSAHKGTVNAVFSQQESTGLMVELIQMYVFLRNMRATPALCVQSLSFLASFGSCCTRVVQ